MKQPVRILSDLHFGHRVSRIAEVECLRPLIQGAGTVIFNGDTWQELARPYRETSQRMLDELKRLCADEGVEAVFLSGNHDPGWPGPGWIELAGGRIVVTHGDALLFASSPWKREILRCGDKVGELWQAHPQAWVDAEERLRVAREIAREMSSVEFPRGRGLLHRVVDAAIPPQRALYMMDAWLRQGEAGMDFCRRYFPKAEVLVMGHFHWPGSWRKDGILTLNTGAFMNPSRARWVEWREGWLEYGKVDESEKTCRKGEVLGVWSV